MKVIDQLKTVASGKQVAIMKPLKPDSFVSISHSISEGIDDRIAAEYVTEARLSFRQLGSRYANEYERNLLSERAAQTIARELYGDVVEKLRDIQIQLWQDAPRYGDKVVEAIDDLISELTLRK